MWKYLIPVALLAIVAAAFYAGLGRGPTVVLPSPLIGKPMPEFSLPSLKDPTRMVGSGDLRGQVALLNVWGSWCVECAYEHEFLTSITRSGTVPLYGLNVPDPDAADPRADALRWLAPRGDPFVFSAVDTDGRVSVDWGVYGAPETFLLGPDGTVLHKRVGQLTPEVWEREFLPLIKAQCGNAPCARAGA